MSLFFLFTDNVMFNVSPDDRVAVFIDGANAYATARALNRDIDFKKLHEMISDDCRLVRINYYTALPDNDEYSPLRPLMDWLVYNDYNVISKPSKRFTDPSGVVRHKGNMDIEMAVDMMTMAPRIDHAIIFTGDGDFRRAVEAIQQIGVRVSVVSSIKTAPAHAADELRRQADDFVEMAELLEVVGKPRVVRASAA